jgi:hypothetical protein
LSVTTGAALPSDDTIVFATFSILSAGACDQHVIAARRKAPPQRGAKLLFGSDTHDDCDRFAHRVLGVLSVFG